MDESGFEAETIRSHGYAPIGKPCIDSYNWQAKKRTNVIGALYEKMLFALEYVETNINSNSEVILFSDDEKVEPFAFDRSQLKVSIYSIDTNDRYTTDVEAIEKDNLVELITDSF